MKLKPFAILVSLTLTLFVSCQSDSPDSSEANNETPEAEADYPLDTCVVSGEKLGSMGEPYVITHEGTEVRFCCDSCLPEFKKDPDKYLAKLEEE
jgi:YHS domain-containing protein